MRFSVRRSDLLREMTLLNGVAGHKATIPQLQHVLIEANGKLKLSATELDLALMTDRCKVNIMEPGMATVHAETFYALTMALPETEITIRTESQKLFISAERFNSKLVTLPVESYPSLPTPSGMSAVIPRAVLKEAVKKIFAKVNDPSRVFLGGGLFELVGGVFCVMSTDALRMSIIKSPYRGADSKVIVPQKTLEELKLLLEEGDDDITYHQDGKRVFFTVDERVLFSSTIDGEFPDLSRITNQQPPLTIEFEREKLLQALIRVALVADKMKAAKFTLDRGRVTLRAATTLGEADEVLLVDGMATGEMWLSTEHLRAFLESTDVDTVSMSFTDDKSPTFWRTLQTDFDYLYILAPMRIV